MDEDGKERRNLMVASTIVVLTWWLDRPLPELVERFLGVKPVVSSEWRAWAAVFVALVYLTWRYRFGKASSEAIDRWREEHEKLRKERTTRLVGRMIDRAFEDGADPLAFKGVLKPYVELRSDQIRRSRAEPNVQILPADVAVRLSGRWKGSATIGFRAIADGRQVHTDTGVPVDFDLRPIRYSGRVQLGTWLRMATYSSALVDLFAPIVLAAVALVIALCNLVGALL